MRNRKEGSWLNTQARISNFKFPLRSKRRKLPLDFRSIFAFLSKTRPTFFFRMTDLSKSDYLKRYTSAGDNDKKKKKKKSKNKEKDSDRPPKRQLAGFVFFANFSVTLCNLEFG